MEKYTNHTYIKYHTAIFTCSIFGLIVSTYLLWTHYQNYTNIIYSSFCAISKNFNCDTVSQSPWSVLFGLPVALWGAIGYLLFITILIQAYKNTPERQFLWSILTIASFGFSLFSIFLAYISSNEIHSYCILCLLTYSINFSLFFLSWIASRRFDSDTFLKRLNSAKKYFTKNISFKITVISFTIFLIFLYGYFPNYWKYPQPPISDYQMTGMTKEGYPWIGSENPKLTIDEYTDYQCFQCYKIHYTLRKIIAKNKYSIRLIHHHYPMDHEVNAVVVPSDFHNGSGKLAKMAILASLRNKFWQFNDLLYSKIRTNSKEISLKELSDATDLDINELTASLSDPTIDELLRRDIWKGMKLGLTGTPSFVINGKVYQGYIPPEIIQSITR